MKATKKSKIISKRALDKFIGILDKDFKTDDKRYNAIVGCGATTARNK